MLPFLRYISLYARVYRTISYYIDTCAYDENPTQKRHIRNISYVQLLYLHIILMNFPEFSLYLSSCRDPLSQ